MNRWWQTLEAAVDWRAIVVVAALVMAPSALLAAVAMFRRMRRLEGAVEGLEQSLGRLGAAVREQKERRRALEAALRRSDERLGQLELRAASRPYEQAIRMASQGGSEDGLMRYFGLTDGEASLVRLLHGDSRRQKQSDTSQHARRA